ncbi:Nitrogen regulatory protein P-II [Pelagirhabdus alkalitolerans]|uniref:Nitrogen regulatory protein P-II n=1 Tax=Pelagirhabdus alkalitolerans TaxID=1612202 RepID=A0A1G6L0F3_9BACI|nr:P-II family nitrogen regulator [Pelagirhabdus alkalitolerans]SDC36839.1 Nitrogen regulatory protein P-II [Pelagirhabdus alkalitolerans]
MIERIQDHKLIISIVKKNQAKKVVHATRLQGAQGGTTVQASGFRLNEKKRILGVPVTREREVVFTVVSESIYVDVLTAIETSAKIDKKTPGIVAVIDIKKVMGISHLTGHEIKDCSKEGELMETEKKQIQHDLIVTIVNNGDAEEVIDAARKAGADGGTIIHGRGTGIHEKAKLFNIMIEPEKDMVLTLVDRNSTTEVLDVINRDVGLSEPGKGIAFVLEVEKTIGINHLFNEKLAQVYNED